MISFHLYAILDIVAIISTQIRILIPSNILDNVVGWHNSLLAINVLVVDKEFLEFRQLFSIFIVYGCFYLLCF